MAASPEQDTMTALRDLSIRWKVAGHLLLILLLVVGNIGVVWWFVQEQSDDGTAINEAGKQRMLIKEMRLTAHLIAMDDAGGAVTSRDLRAALADNAADFERMLTALIHGNASMDIDPAPPMVRRELETVRTSWRPYRVHLQTIIAAPRTSERFETSMGYVQANTDSLLSLTDAAVQAYEAAFRREVARLQTLLAVLLGLDLLLIPLLFAFIDRRIFRPINRITATARAVANGDIERSIPDVEGDNEVGTLSRSLREMTDQLLAAIRNVRRFEEAIEHAGHAIYITDTDGRIEYVNPAFSDVTGYTEAEALGATPRLLNSGKQPESYYEDLWSTLTAGEVWEEEIVNMRSSGELFHGYQTIAPITDEAGDTVGYVAILADRTEDIVSTQQNQVLSRVLRHNLRTELNVILLYVKELATAEHDEARDTYVDNINDRIGNLVDLSDKTDRFTRTLSRDAAWQQPICAVVERVCAAMAERFPVAELTVETPDGEIDVMANVELVIEALVENAIIYNDQDSPKVTVSVELIEESGPPPMVRVEVSDNGPGIPPEERTVIEEGEETPLYHGSGLGLWIVHWTVTLAGGFVEIHDREPRGTTVSLTLPHASVKPFPPDDETETDIVTNEYFEREPNYND